VATNQDYIDALLIERAGYLRVGKPERVKQVDEALAARGYTAPRAEAPAADAPASRGRRTAKG
jgi:hypothetical protein